MLLLDHLAIVCADLDEGSRWLEQALGVSLQAGGQHARYGTHNRLLGLAEGLYLEVIAPDPDASIQGPRWFGLDAAPDVPVLGNWICQAENLDLFRQTAGPAVALERGALAWQITVPDDGSLPFGGAFPTLIKWAKSVEHPAKTLKPSGVRLRQLDVTTPHAEQVVIECGEIDPRVVFIAGERVELRASFDTPNGPRVI